MNDYRTYITQAGLAAIQKAKAQGAVFELAHLVVGSGQLATSGDPRQRNSLITQQHKVALNSIRVSEHDPTIVIAEGLVAANIGGFSIYEAGVLDANGVLVAYARQPGDYKPVASEGMVNDYLVRLQLKVSNAADVTLNVDESRGYLARDEAYRMHVALATNQTRSDLEQLRQADRIKQITGAY